MVLKYYKSLVCKIKFSFVTSVFFVVDDVDVVVVVVVAAVVFVISVVDGTN